MSRIHNQYRELESSYNYIDKTECLEKEIERFPSVYIEGAAGCGKTTMMRMSLRISARCSSCKLRKVCNTCVAAAIAETGKADGVPEYLCRYTEATVRYLKETSKK